MKQHLSGRQITAWMAGERTPEEERHVGDCPECRAEVAGFENAVRWFRGSVREWSSRHPLGDWKPEPAVRRAMAPPRWALIAAALVILAGVPIYRNVERRREAEQARADAVLLEQVDAGLARPVPAPMEPLLSLLPGEIR